MISYRVVDIFCFLILTYRLNCFDNFRVRSTRKAHVAFSGYLLLPDSRLKIDSYSTVGMSRRSLKVFFFLFTKKCVSSVCCMLVMCICLWALLVCYDGIFKFACHKQKVIMETFTTPQPPSSAWWSYIWICYIIFFMVCVLWSNDHSVWNNDHNSVSPKDAHFNKVSVVMGD